MNHNYKKTDFPTADIRRFLEPGPIVLVSSAYKGETNIMTMGWYTVMEFTPSLLGCVIVGANHSFDLIKKSKECVINIPTYDMLETVVGIGNSHGGELDKFDHFKLTRCDAAVVGAPLIKECYANFECRVADVSMLPKYSFFILEVVKAHVATRPKYPRTVHYRGDGVFMISGKHVAMPEKFRPENL